MKSFNCDSAREAMVDAMTGSLSAEDQDALERHTASCGSCRAEYDLLRQTWKLLERDSNPEPPPDGLRRLVSELGNASPSGSPYWQRAVFSVLILFGLAASYIAGGTRKGAPENATTVQATDSTPDGTRYMLLLHGGDALDESVQSFGISRLVSEYTDWGQDLASESSLVDANKLVDDPGTWLVGDDGEQIDPDPGTYTRVTGYYMVVAESEEDALQMARASPHLRYGGAVEVRKVDLQD